MATEMHSHATVHGFIPENDPKSVKTRKTIWLTFWILFAITTVEFIIAFTMAASVGRIIIFVALTLVKAFFIVAEFMHLKHEVRVLILSVVIPVLFVIWFIVAMLYEGNSIHIAR